VGASSSPNHCRSGGSIYSLRSVMPNVSWVIMLKVIFLAFTLPAATIMDFDFALATYVQSNVSVPLCKSIGNMRILRDLEERRPACTIAGYVPCDGFPESCCPSGGTCCSDGSEIACQWRPFKFLFIPLMRTKIDDTFCRLL
jgi:hypothetical protein